jgi:hypothetical protein
MERGAAAQNTSPHIGEPDAVPLPEPHHTRGRIMEPRTQISEFAAGEPDAGISHASTPATALVRRSTAAGAYGLKATARTVPAIGTSAPRRRRATWSTCSRRPADLPHTAPADDPPSRVLAPASGQQYDDQEENGAQGQGRHPWATDVQHVGDHAGGGVRAGESEHNRDDHGASSPVEDVHGRRGGSVTTRGLAASPGTRRPDIHVGGLLLVFSIAPPEMDVNPPSG